jgi:hypothetical protein
MKKDTLSATSSAYPPYSSQQTSHYLNLYDYIFLLVQTLWWSFGGILIVGVIANPTLSACLHCIPTLIFYHIGVYLILQGTGKLQTYRSRATNPIIFPILSATTSTFLLVGLTYLAFFETSLPFALGAVIVFLTTPPIVVPISILLFRHIVTDPKALLQAYNYHRNTSNPQNYDRLSASASTRETPRP